jgi:hypothetical protein
VDRFPTIEAVSLDGRRWRLPDDLDGTTVLILAFDRWQQWEVDDWIRELQALACPHPIFEIPTIGRRYRWMRSFIDGGMRAGIHDPVVRARTLTAYTDVGRVLRGLGVRTTDHVVAALVEANGTVRECYQGTFEAGVGARLAAGA